MCFSAKINKKNLNFKGIERIPTLINQPNAFVFASTDYGAHFAEIYAGSRGADHIRGDLGEISSSFILASNHRIPKQIILRIDQLTSIIMESGLNKFYRTFARYLGKIRGKNYDRSNNAFHQVSMKTFYFPMAMYAILVMSSMLLFGCEIIYHNYKHRKYLQGYVP